LKPSGKALGGLLAAREGAKFCGYDREVVPTPLTALATGLALVPLVVAGSIPGHEIEHPMAVVILGGLATSTLLNLFVVPTLYLKFGRSRERNPMSGQVVIAAE
jgi:Cu/Ag efflux pump CusA